MSAKHKRPFYVFAAVAVVCCLVLASGWSGRATHGPGGEPGSPVASTSIAEVVRGHVLGLAGQDPTYRDSLKYALIQQALVDHLTDAPGDDPSQTGPNAAPGTGAGVLQNPLGPPDHDLTGQQPPGPVDDGDGVRVRGTDGDEEESDEEPDAPEGESTDEPGDEQSDQPGDEQSEAPEDEETESNVDPMSEDEDPTAGGEGDPDPGGEQGDGDQGQPGDGVEP